MTNGEEREPSQTLLREIIVGRNPVLELLRSGHGADVLYVSGESGGGSLRTILAIAKEQGVPVKRVKEITLEQMSGGAAHQGVAAAVAAHDYSTLDEILDGIGPEPPFLVLADGLQDPHNLGAVIRTAEAAGAHGLILPKHRSVSLTPVVYKAAAGALEYLPVARETNLVSVIKTLKARGIWVYGADMAGESYDRVRMDGPAALVIGSEGEGLGRLVREHCDQLVSLPMYGTISSLNASVAAGILLYEIARQRERAGQGSRNGNREGLSQT